MEPGPGLSLPGDRLIVTHGEGKSLHRVCIVDMKGRIIQYHGGEAGSGVGQMKNPRYLALDECSNVLVTEQFNNRVALLSPSLTHLGYITVPEHNLSGPYTMHLDQSSRRLYIGETSSTVGCVLVISV